MIIDTPYEFGELVFLKTDENQKERMITEIRIKPSGVMFELSMADNSSLHYEFEFDRELSLEKKLGRND